MSNIKIDQLLTPGSVIRTKTIKSEWISNVIFKASDDIIQIELTQNYIDNLSMVGDQIKCKFSNSENEYILDGIIENIDADGQKIIAIKINNISKFKNVREHSRYDAYIISRITPNMEAPAFSIVTSISPTGISIVSKSEILATSNVFVEVFIDTGNILRFYGDILRSSITERGFEYGIKYVTMDVQNISALNKTLESFKSKDELLIDNFVKQKKSM